jgi:hypothetical protein
MIYFVVFIGDQSSTKLLKMLAKKLRNLCTIEGTYCAFVPIGGDFVKRFFV